MIRPNMPSVCMLSRAVGWTAATPELGARFSKFVRGAAPSNIGAACTVGVNVSNPPVYVDPTAATTSTLSNVVAGTDGSTGPISNGSSTISAAVTRRDCGPGWAKVIRVIEAVGSVLTTGT